MNLHLTSFHEAKIGELHTLKAIPHSGASIAGSCEADPATQAPFEQHVSRVAVHSRVAVYSRVAVHSCEASTAGSRGWRVSVVLLRLG